MADSSSDYPIISLFTKDDPDTIGSLERNKHFLLGHCGFLMFNILNVCGILLFYGFVFQRLMENKLMKFAFLACFFQIFSCFGSIHRYNINDEYGPWSIKSILPSLVAYTFFNYVMFHYALNKNCKRSIFGIGYMIIGAVACVIAACAVWFLLWKRDWVSSDFMAFRYFVVGSTVFQLLSYIRLLWAFSKGQIRLPENHIVSNDALTRLLQTAIGLIVFDLVCKGSAMPVFQFPTTGLTYTVMVIVTPVVSQMDFMSNTAQGYERGDGSDCNSEGTVSDLIEGPEASLESFSCTRK